MNYRILLVCAVLLSGCTGIQPPKVENTHTYLLDASPAARQLATKRDQVLAVNMPGSRPGFDTSQMAYQLRPLELEYFVTQRWADTPAMMLKPLLMQALEPGFRAVLPAPGALPADLRLDTELIRLQQNFTEKPSRVQLTLRAQLTDVKDKRVLAVQLFDVSEPAQTDDAYGGVIAANRALQHVLAQLLEFCLNASAGK